MRLNKGDHLAFSACITNSEKRENEIFDMFLLCNVYTTIRYKSFPLPLLPSPTRWEDSSVGRRPDSKKEIAAREMNVSETLLPSASLVVRADST